MNPKKTVGLGAVLLAAACVTAAPANAQMRSDLYAGFKAGYNSASWSGVSSADRDRKGGFVGGGFITYDLSQWLFVQGELLYSQKGVKLLDEDLSLDYLEVPFLLGTQYDARTVIARIYAGLYLGFQVRCEIESPGCEDFGRMDLGVPFGGGIDFFAGRTRIGVDLRVGLGLTDLNGDAPGDFKNRASSFTGSVGFPIG